jgi:hypothetical protein
MLTEHTLSLTACGLVGVGYLLGWGRGSRWTRAVLTDPNGCAPLGAPHWS